MKELQAHLLDCALGWLISFMTALLVVDVMTPKIICITLMGAAIPAFIKLRDWNASGFNKKARIQSHMFF